MGIKIHQIGRVVNPMSQWCTYWPSLVRDPVQIRGTNQRNILCLFVYMMVRVQLPSWVLPQGLACGSSFCGDGPSNRCLTWPWDDRCNASIETAVLWVCGKWGLFRELMAPHLLVWKVERILDGQQRLQNGWTHGNIKSGINTWLLQQDCSKDYL